MRFWIGRKNNGITLVELVVSMVILSVVAVIAAQSFLVVLRADQEMESRSGAMRSLQFAMDQLRRDVSNLVPAKVAGFEPFSESLDPSSGAASYRLLTRLPERFARETVPGQAQAMLVEYSLVPEDKQEGIHLVYQRQPVGSGGRLGEPLRGILAEKLSSFRLTAVERDDKDGDKSGVRVPRAVKVSLQFHLVDVTEQYSFELPVGAEPDKKKKGEEAEAGDSASAEARSS